MSDWFGRHGTLDASRKVVRISQFAAPVWSLGREGKDGQR